MEGEAGSSPTELCVAFRLGLLNYEKALNLQRRLAWLRQYGLVPDLILFLEHPPVFTLGIKASWKNLLLPRGRLEALGFAVVETDRGGDVTYHGPGQLVCYFIRDLRGKDVIEHLRYLEETVILALSRFGIAASRVRGLPGVWVEGKKVCSIGLAVSSGIVYHGFALNVNNDLTPFSYIYPCGLRGKEMTSLSRLLKREFKVDEVLPPVCESLSQVFRLSISLRDKRELQQLLKTPGDEREEFSAFLVED